MDKSKLVVVLTLVLAAAAIRVEAQVAEVSLGVLDADRDSYLHVHPDAFRPAPPIAPTSGEFRMGNLLQFAGAA